MKATETEPGTWTVVAESEAEATSMRWLFSLSSAKEKIEEPERPRWFEDFAKMRESAAEHWTSERARGVEGEIFEAYEDVHLRVLGLRCRRTEATWAVSLMAIRNDSSGWAAVMTTPERRRMFAAHPNFAKWSRSRHPLDPCEGITLDLKEGRFVSA